MKYIWHMLGMSASNHSLFAHRLALVIPTIFDVAREADVAASCTGPALATALLPAPGRAAGAPSWSGTRCEPTAARTGSIRRGKLLCSSRPPTELQGFGISHYHSGPRVGCGNGGCLFVRRSARAPRAWSRRRTVRAGHRRSAKTCTSRRVPRPSD